jgi:hypothetical protein
MYGGDGLCTSAKKKYSQTCLVHHLYPDSLPIQLCADPSTGEELERRNGGSRAKGLGHTLSAVI